MRSIARGLSGMRRRIPTEYTQTTFLFYTVQAEGAQDGEGINGQCNGVRGSGRPSGESEAYRTGGFTHRGRNGADDGQHQIKTGS